MRRGYTFSHGGGGPQVGEVPRLGGVTNLSILSLFFLGCFHMRGGVNLVSRSLVDEAEGEISPSASSTRDLGTRLRGGTSPRRVTRSAVPGNPLRWGKFSPCEC